MMRMVSRRNMFVSLVVLSLFVAVGCNCPMKTKGETPDTLSNAARMLKKQGRVAAATDCLEKALKLHPTSLMALQERAEAATMSKDYQTASQMYERALREKQDVSTINNLAIAYSELGRQDDAIKSYERAIRLEPDEARGYYNLGTALEKVYRFKEASKAYQSALEHEPEVAKYYNNLGGCLGALNKTETAIRAYKWGLKLDKKFVDIYYNWGNLLLATGKVEEAIEPLEHALKLNKKHAKAKAKLKEANAQLEEKVEAFKSQIDDAILKAQKMV
jgi:tetratricopeptide (TPR) repeat protein